LRPAKAACNVSLQVHGVHRPRCWPFREVIAGNAPATWCSLGMGSPFSNTEAVLEAINCLCSDLGMAQRARSP